MENKTPNFLTELIIRLFSDNPKFFKVIQAISLGVGGLSAVIMYVKSNAIAEVPAWLGTLDSVSVVIGSVVATVIAQLPVPNK